MKLFIYAEPAQEYVVADMINTIEVSKGYKNNFQINGSLNHRLYRIDLGPVSEEHAHKLRRELCEWIARAAASNEPSAVVLECNAGAWRQQ